MSTIKKYKLNSNEIFSFKCTAGCKEEKKTQ